MSDPSDELAFLAVLANVQFLSFPKEDSNPHSQNQNLKCYHYTIGECKVRTTIQANEKKVNWGRQKIARKRAFHGIGRHL